MFIRLVVIAEIDVRIRLMRDIGQFNYRSSRNRSWVANQVRSTSSARPNNDYFMHSFDTANMADKH